MLIIYPIFSYLLKYKLCEDNNVKLHYIKYDDKNIEELLNKILCI